MLRFACLVVACALASALNVAPTLNVRARTSTVRAAPVAMQMFGKKKTAEEILEEKGYWPGEWVCADCGYIYEPGTTPPFEELRVKWKCPQCAGPRRRFVKKAGDQYGELNDSPLFLITGVSAIVIAGLVALGLSI